MNIFRELLQFIGIIVAIVGLVLCMCECDALALQFRTLFVGFITFLSGVLLAYIGSQLPESVKA